MNQPYLPIGTQGVFTYHAVNSPLFMAMDDPILHRFVFYLAEKKAEQESNPLTRITFELTRQFIKDVREAFRRKILDGERHLHLLAHLLASVLLEGDFELYSNVIGVLPDADKRPFLIRERLSQDTLLSVMDIDLGNHMLDNFRYRQGRSWVPLDLSANFVEYIPMKRPESGVNRLTSRVKAEEELWNKVADEIFHLDELISCDKHLRQYSKYVKDIFGIKIVCDDDPTCLDVHARLKKLTLGLQQPVVESLQQIAGGDWCPLDRPLEFIETKDYLTCDQSQMKRTGWKALKSVVRWDNRLFEIQVQPLGNYYLELDHMSDPSHRSFKLQRDCMRDEVAELIPLYGFYRDLLKNIFNEEDVESFESEHASVVVLK